MELWEHMPGNDPSRVLGFLRKAGIGRQDILKTAELFCPSGLYPQFSLPEVYVLLAYLQEGLFVMDLRPPIATAPLISTAGVDFRGGSETEAHIALKKASTLWLREQGVQEVDYEGEYDAGEFDVASRDRRWIVECGGSRPSKVYDFLPKNPDSKLVVFNQVGLAIFSTGPRGLVEEVLRLREEKMREAIDGMDSFL